MRLILKGEDCGFTWSASHLLPGHYKCSRMHGHNYVMDIEINSNTIKNGMIVDFVEIKKMVRQMIEKYDHRLLLPDPKQPFMEIKYMNYENEQFVHLKYTGLEDEIKQYTIPASDAVIMEDVDFVTAENLSEYFKKQIEEIVYSLNPDIDSLYVTIYEDSGQGARS